MSGGSGDWHSAADRLALFMQRYAVDDDKVTRQLGWSEEKLRAYLSPEARRLKAASDVRPTTSTWTLSTSWRFITAVQ